MDEHNWTERKYNTYYDYYSRNCLTCRLEEVYYLAPGVSYYYLSKRKITVIQKIPTCNEVIMNSILK